MRKKITLLRTIAKRAYYRVMLDISVRKWMKYQFDHAWAITKANEWRDKHFKFIDAYEGLED